MSILHRTLLSAKSYDEELTTAKKNDGKDTGYALGLNVGKRNGRTIISHGGEGAGYLSINRIYPDDDAAVVVFTNTFSADPQREIADAIDFAVLAPIGIDARLRTVFNDLQDGRPDRSVFTADFNAYLDAGTAAAYAHTLGPLGRPTAFVQTGSEDRGGMKFYDYRIIADDRQLSLSVYVTSEGKIEQFLIAPAAQ